MHCSPTSLKIMVTLLSTVVILSQAYSAICTNVSPGPEYIGRVRDACGVYREAVPILLDDILRLSTDTLRYIFVTWPDLPESSGSNVDQNTLANGSMALEKSILRLQALIVNDIGKVLDEIARAANLTEILQAAKSRGYKLHMI